ncbi:MAG: hypothetical protein KBC17_01635 [Candidatus Pacebacteria bacterium]|nr:hypothetical protein [Candidatus Paceibacterota bacterium]
MQQFLSYASGILIATSCIPYIRDILRGKTIPERATWFIWGILLTIAFFAQLAEGGTWSLITTGIDWLGVVIIFVLSIKYGTGGTKKLDIFALLGAGIGLLIWYLTDNALYAILITIFVDLMGALPTLVKTYREPKTETWYAYIICGIGGFLGALSVGSFEFSLYIFPLWIGIINTSIGLTSLIKRTISTT